MCVRENVAIVNVDDNGNDNTHTYRILKAHLFANGFKMPINETKYASSPLLFIIHVKLDESLCAKKSLI